MLSEMFDKLNTKLADKVGFTEDGIEFASPDREIKRLVEGVTGGGEDLRKYLIYRHYDKEKQIYLNSENYLGFILEIAPLVGVSEDIEKNIEFLLNNDLPLGGSLNFLLVANHDISNLITAWQTSNNMSNEVINQLKNKRAELFFEMAENFNNRVKLICRDYRIYLSYSQQLAPTEDNLEKFLSFREVLVKKLEVLKLAYKMIEADELIDVVNDVVQMQLAKSQQDSYRYNEHEELSLQMLQLFDGLQINKDHILQLRCNMVSKIFEVTELPSEFSLNAMIKLLGSEENVAMNIPGRFIISYSITNDLGDAMQGALMHQGEVVMKESENFLHRLNHGMKIRAKEWYEICSRLQKKEKCLHESFKVMVTAPKELISKAEQSLISLYNINNFKLASAKYMQLVLLQSMLPMQQGIMHSTLKSFKLARKSLVKETMTRIPIHAEWKGMHSTGLLLAGRRGQVFSWTPFKKINDGNYNVCVFAPAGGGKSVLLQSLVTSFVADNISCYVLDIGQSFLNSGEIVNGQILRFGNNTKLNLNPFSALSEQRELLLKQRQQNKGEHVLTKDEIELINDLKILSKELLATMCNVKSNDAYLRGALEEVINDALNYYDFEINLDKFIVFLARHENADLRTFSKTLYPYTNDGVYGKYFSSNDELKFTNLLTIFEFEEIKDNEQLISIVLQCVMQYIIRPFLVGDRQKRFAIIVDEAWMLLKHAPAFWAAQARTLRKYEGSLIICVQGYDDLSHTPEHRTILQNSAWKIILKQNSTSIEPFKADEELNKVIPLIRSLSFSPGQFSELFIYATGIKVVGRLILDNFSLVAYSTDGATFNAVSRLVASGMRRLEAIEEIVYAKYKDAPMFDWTKTQVTVVNKLLRDKFQIIATTTDAKIIDAVTSRIKAGMSKVRAIQEVIYEQYGDVEVAELSTAKLLSIEQISEEEIAHQPTAEEVA